MNNYFQEINRDFLLYTNDTTTNFVIYDYVVIDKLIKHNYFLHSVNQRKLALIVLVDYQLLNVDSCDEGHSIEKIQRLYVWSSTHALLNNVCFKEHNNIKNNKLSRKNNFKYSAKFCICYLFFYKYYLILKSLYCLYLIYLLVFI